MSIAALAQVQDELRRLVIAGSNLAPGDFRLKKLVPPLEKAGAKAPVFAKVAETTRRLVDGNEKDAPATLLELGTLVGAVLYTQGETGAKGKLQPVEATELGPLETGTSARVLKPLIEALTTTGSGRLEIVRDAIDRGAFRDLRLVNPAIDAIDDPYGEIADLVAEKVLPLYGKVVCPRFRETFDHKGRGGHVRRLKLLHQLDPKATTDLVELSLEEGSKEMKVAALVCLKGSKAGLPHLLEQTNAKAKDVRAAAYEGMSETRHAEVTEAFKKALSGKDLEIAAEPASRNPDPKLLDWMLEEGRSQLDDLLATKAKAKLSRAVERFIEFLDGFRRRTDKRSVAFLEECFDRREELAALSTRDFDGEMVLWKVTNLLCYTRSKPVLAKVAAGHEALPAGLLAFAFFAASATSKPAAVYDVFSPYLLARKAARRRKDDPTEERREAVREVLTATTPRYHWWLHDDLGIGDRAAEIELDDRWLDAAVEANDLELVVALLRRDHAKANDFVAEQVGGMIRKRGDDWRILQALEAMIEMEYPRTMELYLEALEQRLGKKRRITYPHEAYWLGRLIPKLDPAVIGDLEALLPRLHEKAVDSLADHIAELKSQKAESSI